MLKISVLLFFVAFRIYCQAPDSSKNVAASLSATMTLNKVMLDKEFDSGSRINTFQLNDSKIRDLALLCKVWGFLKYHHPAIAAGDYNWDYELFRIMPKVIASQNQEEINNILLNWIESLGEFEVGVSMSFQDSLLKQKPNFDWINPEKTGYLLQKKLLAVKDAKRTKNHYYIGTNIFESPKFLDHHTFPNMIYEDIGFKLLSLYKYWNIIEYYFPYKYLIDENWDEVLIEFIPKFINSVTEQEFKLQTLSLITKINDSHASTIDTDKTIFNYFGSYQAPFKVIFIDNQAVVSKFTDVDTTYAADLKAGDIILSVNGKSVSEIIEEKSKFMPSSKQITLLKSVGEILLRGNDTILNIKYLRDGTTNRTQIALKNIYSIKSNPKDSFFRFIKPDISYLNPRDVDDKRLKLIVPEILKSKGLIVDLRYYPKQAFVNELCDYLLPDPIVYQKYAVPDLQFPGFFFIRDYKKIGKHNPDYYTGKVCIIINEETISRGESSAMALRLAPNSTLIGSQTVGARGFISNITLPGSISTQISGLGFYYPDLREVQRIGIMPDIEVKPTIQGIREGRDELLEKAIELINEE